MKCLAFVLLLLLAGCTDEAERAQQLVLRKKKNPFTAGKGQKELRTSDEMEVVLGMVQQSAMDDSDDAQTVAEWIGSSLQKEQGQIMFPKWDVQRRGNHKYAVVFTYTVLGDDYSITRKGYSWQVDYVLQLVGQMNRISEDELERQSGHKSVLQRRADVSERMINLE